MKTFSSLLKIASYVFRRLLRVLNWFLLWILKVSDFERNIFGVFGQSSIPPVRNFVGGQNVSEKNILLSLLSTLQAKNFRTSDENTLAVFSNLPSTCSKEDFWREVSWKKNFPQLPTWVSAECFQTFNKIFPTCSPQTSFFICRAWCWRQKNSEKEKNFKTFSEFWSDGLRTSDETVDAVSHHTWTFRQSSRICIVNVQEKSLGRKIFPESFFAHLSLILSGKLSDFELNFLKHNLNEGHCTCPKKKMNGKK